MYARSVGHVPVPVAEAFDFAADPWLLERWHGLVTSVDSTERLARAGATLDAVIRTGRRGVPTRWRVERRLRWNLHLRSEDGAGRSARMLLSFSPWDGGCVVELGFSCDEGYAQLHSSRIRQALARRRLRRSLVELSRIVAVGDDDRAPAQVGVGRTRPAVAVAGLAGGR